MILSTQQISLQARLLDNRDGELSVLHPPHAQFTELGISFIS